MAHPQSGWQQHGITPACAFQLFGMRRAGNHGIANWLVRNAPTNATGALFYNNCRYGADPLMKFASLDVYDAQGVAVLPEARGPKRRIQDAGPRPMVVVSYEDRMPAHIGAPQKASRGYSDSDFTHSVLIYRSVLNWSASLLAKLQRNPGYGPVERFRVMMNAVSTYLDGLDCVAENRSVNICYDDWMAFPDARARLLQSLGLPCRDNTRGQVQRFGGGSSFQPEAGGAAALNSLSRVAEMADDREYQMLLWTIAQDAHAIQRLMPHFPDDAARLTALAQAASFDITLPSRKDTR
ncbi:MAG: hypothetical protein WBC93_04605 [Sulfitobacter sp.]